MRSLRPDGPYSASNMQRWNDALLDACRYPNMRIYDWAAVARDGWFIEDGIHYTSPGYAPGRAGSPARWRGRSRAGRAGLELRRRLDE